MAPSASAAYRWTVSRLGHEPMAALSAEDWSSGSIPPREQPLEVVVEPVAAEPAFDQRVGR